MDDGKDVYALMQTDRNGREFIQEFDSREEAESYQRDNGGVLMIRKTIPGEPGLWWVPNE